MRVWWHQLHARLVPSALTRLSLQTQESVSSDATTQERVLCRYTQLTLTSAATIFHTLASEARLEKYARQIRLGDA